MSQDLTLGAPARHSLGSSASRRAGFDLADAVGELLVKHDDRLLADIGLSRDDVLGPERRFWEEWRALREPWRL